MACLLVRGLVSLGGANGKIRIWMLLMFWELMELREVGKAASLDLSIAKIVFLSGWLYPIPDFVKNQFDSSGSAKPRSLTTPLGAEVNSIPTCRRVGALYSQIR